MASAGDSLRRLATRAERFERQWPDEAAAVVERAVAGQLRSATGDGAFSHGRKMGRATVAVRRHGKTTVVSADGSRAVWAILERGTRAHDVKARAGKVLRTPNGPRAKVHVSGVKGRRSWSKGVESATPQVRSSAQKAVRAVIRG